MAPNQTGNALMQIWMRRGWLACMLWPLSLLFGLLLKLRLFFYRCGWFDQKKLAVPVIVVGNIFVGGTGKTPLTIWLLDQLKQQGFKPGVISRGYGSKHQRPCFVTKESDVREVGDEPVLIVQRSNCPMVVGRNRFEAGRTLLNQFPEVDVIISDDGLQHYALHRDVEIMLFDSRGSGNGWLFPAGPLREPVSRRRDITVANLNLGDKISPTLPQDTVRMQLTSQTAYQLMDPDQVTALTSLPANLEIVAAAGIGSPERFFMMLRAQGLTINALPLPDHFNYISNPFETLRADIILITEKDAVKCREISEIAKDARIWVVPVNAGIDPGMLDAILKILTKKRRNT
jgi:tetraacyldisaccharide 4'-kinase